MWRIQNGSVAVVGLVVTVLMAGCAFVQGEDPDASQRREELASALDVAVSSVLVPEGWESEIVPVVGGGVGYRFSPDLSSSGTWMLVSVVPQKVSEEGESPDDRFWRFIDQVVEGPMQFVDEPVATSASGLPGYRYELSGGVGERTGQPLGGFLAIFFGPGYNYEVWVQFELSDRDDMGVLFDDTLSGLTLAPYEDSI